MSSRVIPFLAFTSLVVLQTANGLAQQIVNLGRLPGGTYTFVSGMTENGSVVVGDGSIAGGSNRAWRWTATSGITNLGVAAGATGSSAYSVSGNGGVVVGTSGAAYDVATRWTQTTGMQSLGSLAAGMPSFAASANIDGSVVFGSSYLSSGLSRAFRWTSAYGIQPFGDLLVDTDQSVGIRLSRDGSTALGYCWHNAPALIMPTACTWAPDGTVTSLGVLAGSELSSPQDLSSDGQVVVGYCADLQGQNARPFRWTAATGMVDLGTPDAATAGVAAAVTADGTITVGYAVVNDAVGALIWTAPGAPVALETYLQSRGVSTAGWTLETALISADGSTFAGNGRFGAAQAAWYVTLGPVACVPPSVTGQSGSAAAAIGSPASFSVSASGTSLAFQWLLDGLPVVGATASVYSIVAVSPEHVGVYSCRIINTCGEASSSPVALTIASTSCPADFNDDGEINPDDLGDFINCYFEDPPCSGADFNDDGDINPDDLGDYINAYFSGSC